MSSDISVLFPRCSEVKTYSTLADSTIPTKRKFEDTNGAIKPDEPVSKKIKIEGSIMIYAFSCRVLHTVVFRGIHDVFIFLCNAYCDVLVQYYI